jgi:hypothetical protein
MTLEKLFKLFNNDLAISIPSGGFILGKVTNSSASIEETAMIKCPVSKALYAIE